MKTQKHSRVLDHSHVTSKTFSGILTMIALATLSACGGGEETSAMNASQLKETVENVSPGVSQEVLENSFSVAPSGSDLDFDQTASDTFVASMQNDVSQASEKALALHNLNGTPTKDARVKFNPGHYIAVPRPDDKQILATLAEIKDLPHVKGLLVRYPWKMLEPSKGVYDFSAIDHDLALASSKGKRLFMMITNKDFSGTNAVPSYLKTAQYEGGGYTIKINAWEGSPRYGENVAMYNDNVRDRMIALTKTLGNRYNRHNNIEGITFNETAMGQPVIPLTAVQKEKFFINLAKVGVETNKAFPNTVVMQFVNFPRTYVNGLVSSMLNNGVALGGPDTFFDDHDINRYVYPHYDTATGKVPIGPSVQPENYMTTSHHGTTPAPKVQDIYTFGKNRLHANYMFWTKYNAKPSQPYTKVLNMFKSSSFPHDAAGGLNRNCPSAYVSCVEKL